MFEIEALHPEILKSYRGTVHGSDRSGVTDIEFPTLNHASQWSVTCDIEDRVTLRDAPTTFDRPVVVQLLDATPLEEGSAMPINNTGAIVVERMGLFFADCAVCGWTGKRGYSTYSGALVRADRHDEVLGHGQSTNADMENGEEMDENLSVEKFAPFSDLPLSVTHLSTHESGCTCSQCHRMWLDSRLQTLPIPDSEFTWDDSKEANIMGVFVNVETDTMLWFMAFIVDMEYTGGSLGNTYWESQSDTLNDRDYALTVFEHVTSATTLEAEEAHANFIPEPTLYTSWQDAPETAVAWGAKRWATSSLWYFGAEPRITINEDNSVTVEYEDTTRGESVSRTLFGHIYS